MIKLKIFNFIIFELMEFVSKFWDSILKTVARRKIFRICHKIFYMRYSRREIISFDNRWWKRVDNIYLKWPVKSTPICSLRPGKWNQHCGMLTQKSIKIEIREQNLWKSLRSSSMFQVAWLLFIITLFLAFQTILVQGYNKNLFGKFEENFRIF